MPRLAASTAKFKPPQQLDNGTAFETSVVANHTKEKEKCPLSNATLNAALMRLENVIDPITRLADAIEAMLPERDEEPTEEYSDESDTEEASDDDSNEAVE